MKCFCASTRRAARLLTRYYEECLRPSGLTPAQFEVMGALSERAGAPQAELAEALCLDQTTLSRNLQVLIGRGWVLPARDGEDRRKARYALTPVGVAAWRGALPDWERAQEQVKRALEKDWQATWAAVERLGRAAL